jgi:hypothetical protein
MRKGTVPQHLKLRDVKHGKPAPTEGGFEGWEADPMTVKWESISGVGGIDHVYRSKARGGRFVYVSAGVTVDPALPGPVTV